MATKDYFNRIHRKIVQNTGASVALRNQSELNSFLNRVRTDIANLTDYVNTIVYPIFQGPGMASSKESILCWGPKWEYDAVLDGLAATTIQTFPEEHGGGPYAPECYWFDDGLGGGRPRSIKETFDCLMAMISEQQVLIQEKEPDLSDIYEQLACLAADDQRIIKDAFGCNYKLACSDTHTKDWPIGKHIYEIFRQVILGHGALNELGIADPDPANGVADPNVCSGTPYPDLYLQIPQSQVIPDICIESWKICSICDPEGWNGGAGTTLKDDLIGILEYIGVEPGNYCANSPVFNNCLFGETEGYSLTQAIDAIAEEVCKKCETSWGKIDTEENGGTVSGNPIEAESCDETLTFVAGPGISLHTESNPDKITISSSSTGISGNLNDAYRFEDNPPVHLGLIELEKDYEDPAHIPNNPWFAHSVPQVGAGIYLMDDREELYSKLFTVAHYGAERAHFSVGYHWGLAFLKEAYESGSISGEEYTEFTKPWRQAKIVHTESSVFYMARQYNYPDGIYLPNTAGVNDNGSINPETGLSDVMPPHNVTGTLQEGAIWISEGNNPDAPWGTDPILDACGNPLEKSHLYYRMPGNGAVYKLSSCGDQGGSEGGNLQDAYDFDKDGDGQSDGGRIMLRKSDEVQNRTFWLMQHSDFVQQNLEADYWTTPTGGFEYQSNSGSVVDPNCPYYLPWFAITDEVAKSNPENPIHGPVGNDDGIRGASVMDRFFSVQFRDQCPIDTGTPEEECCCDVDPKTGLPNNPSQEFLYDWGGPSNIVPLTSCPGYLGTCEINPETGYPRDGLAWVKVSGLINPSQSVIQYNPGDCYWMSFPVNELDGREFPVCFNVTETGAVRYRLEHKCMCEIDGEQYVLIVDVSQNPLGRPLQGHKVDLSCLPCCCNFEDQNQIYLNPLWKFYKGDTDANVGESTLPRRSNEYSISPYLAYDPASTGAATHLLPPVNENLNDCYWDDTKVGLNIGGASILGSPVDAFGNAITINGHGNFLILYSEDQLAEANISPGDSVYYNAGDCVWLSLDLAPEQEDVETTLWLCFRALQDIQFSFTNCYWTNDHLVANGLSPVFKDYFGNQAPGDAKYYGCVGPDLILDLLSAASGGENDNAYWELLPFPCTWFSGAVVLGGGGSNISSTTSSGMSTATRGWEEGDYEQTETPDMPAIAMQDNPIMQMNSVSASNYDLASLDGQISYNTDLLASSVENTINRTYFSNLNSAVLDVSQIQLSQSAHQILADGVRNTYVMDGEIQANVQAGNYAHFAAVNLDADLLATDSTLNRALAGASTTADGSSSGYVSTLGSESPPSVRRDSGILHGGSGVNTDAAASDGQGIAGVGGQLAAANGGGFTATIDGGQTVDGGQNEYTPQTGSGNCDVYLKGYLEADPLNPSKGRFTIKYKGGGLGRPLAGIIAYTNDLNVELDVGEPNAGLFAGDAFDKNWDATGTDLEAAGVDYWEAEAPIDNPEYIDAIPNDYEVFGSWYVADKDGESLVSGEVEVRTCRVLVVTEFGTNPPERNIYAADGKGWHCSTQGEPTGIDQDFAGIYWDAKAVSSSEGGRVNIYYTVPELSPYRHKGIAYIDMYVDATNVLEGDGVTPIDVTCIDPDDIVGGELFTSGWAGAISYAERFSGNPLPTGHFRFIASPLASVSAAIAADDYQTAGDILATTDLGDVPRCLKINQETTRFPCNVDVANPGPTHQVLASILPGQKNGCYGGIYSLLENSQPGTYDDRTGLCFEDPCPLLYEGTNVIGTLHATFGSIADPRDPVAMGTELVIKPMPGGVFNTGNKQFAQTIDFWMSTSTQTPSFSELSNVFFDMELDCFLNIDGEAILPPLVEEQLIGGALKDCNYLMRYHAISNHPVGEPTTKLSPKGQVYAFHDGNSTCCIPAPPYSTTPTTNSTGDKVLLARFAVEPYEVPSESCLTYEYDTGGYWNAFGCKDCGEYGRDVISEGICCVEVDVPSVPQESNCTKWPSVHFWQSPAYFSCMPKGWAPNTCENEGVIWVGSRRADDVTEGLGNNCTVYYREPDNGTVHDLTLGSGGSSGGLERFTNFSIGELGGSATPSAKNYSAGINDMFKLYAMEGIQLVTEDSPLLPSGENAAGITFDYGQNYPSQADKTLPKHFKYNLSISSGAGTPVDGEVYEKAAEPIMSLYKSDSYSSEPSWRGIQLLESGQSSSVSVMRSHSDPGGLQGDSLIFRKLRVVSSSSTSTPLSVRAGVLGDAEFVFNADALPIESLGNVSEDPKSDGDTLVWDSGSGQYKPSSVYPQTFLELKPLNDFPTGLVSSDRGKVIFIDGSQTIPSGFYIFNGIAWAEWVLF